MEKSKDCIGYCDPSTMGYASGLKTSACARSEFERILLLTPAGHSVNLFFETVSDYANRYKNPRAEIPMSLATDVLYAIGSIRAEPNFLGEGNWFIIFPRVFIYNVEDEAKKEQAEDKVLILARENGVIHVRTFSARKWMEAYAKIENSYVCFKGLTIASVKTVLVSQSKG